MSMAFTFANLSTALTSFRDQMSESYSNCSLAAGRTSVVLPPPRWPHAARRAPRTSIQWSQGPPGLLSRGDCLDRTDQIAAAVPVIPFLRVHLTGLGQLNSSNPKEMSWRRRMAHLLTTETKTRNVAVVS